MMSVRGTPDDLRGARILLTNDDGYGAPGLACLYGIMAELCDDLWVVAPETDQSGAGHSLTLRRPLRITERDTRRYSVDGTPTDCVLLALNRIMRDRRPDYVFSGINLGTNLGEDVTYSGTVSAAFESVVLGVPAIAFSQETGPDSNAEWSVPKARLAGLARTLIERGWPRDTVINVNFPHAGDRGVTGIAATRLGRHKIGDQTVRAHDPAGRPYYWIGDMDTAPDPGDGSDVAAVANGLISVTPLSLDFTDRRTLADLEGVFG